MPETPRHLTHLRLERPSEGVALLTLDNPDMRNAMSDEMTASWIAAIDELASDASLRAVVVTGAGSAFCSGGNTSWIASEPDASVDQLRRRMAGRSRPGVQRRGLAGPAGFEPRRIGDEGGPAARRRAPAGVAGVDRRHRGPGGVARERLPSGTVSSEPLTITILEGDETGQELLEQALRVLDPEVIGLSVALDRFDLSLENRRKTDNKVVEESAAAMRASGLGIKAATITPETSALIAR